LLAVFTDDDVLNYRAKNSAQRCQRVGQPLPVVRQCPPRQRCEARWKSHRNGRRLGRQAAKRSPSCLR
jgi:hypothetical protein